MKRFWILLGLLAALLLVLGGCGTVTGETGTLTVSFKVSTDPSVYPAFPPVGRAVSRVIPSGSTGIDVAVYNESTGWHHTESIAIVAGQTEYSSQIDGIPVGTGYTVEVLPYDNQGWTLAMGRETGLEVQASSIAISYITLDWILGSVSNLPTSVASGSAVSATGSLTFPCDISSFDIDGIYARLTGSSSTFYLAGSGFASFYAVTPQSFNLSGTSPTITGSYALDSLQMDYVQPVTGTTYYLGYIIDPPQTLTVDATGSISVSIQ